LKPKKYFQLEDWRIRPLPEAMFSYARQDTHYLLYIYDRLCEELRKQSSLHEHRNLLRDAYRASIEISMLTWKKPEINSLEYQSILSRRKLQFNEKQILVLRALCRWREETARMEDESLAYVLPEFKLIQIARRIPQTLTELYCCCCNNKNNDSSCYNENAIPPLLKKYENEVLRLVAESIAKYNGSLSTATKDESIGNNLDSNPRSTVTLVVSSDSDRVAPVSISSTGSLFSSNVGEQKNESMSTKFDEIRQQVIEQWQSRLYSKPNLKETQKEENEEENKTRQDSMEAENPVENNDEKRKEFKFPQEDIILIADSSSKKKNKKKNRKKKTKKKKKGKSSSTNKLALSGFLDKVKNGSINNNNSNKNKNGNNKGVGEQAAVHKKGIKKNRNPSLSSVRLKQGNRSATF
jgi:ribonuclease D